MSPLQEELVDGFDAVIRSATKMTADAIASTPSLRLIGRQVWG